MSRDWFAVEMINLDGDSHYDILRDADALSDFVRVNASDLATLKISAVTRETLASARIAETFES